MTLSCPRQRTNPEVAQAPWADAQTKRATEIRSAGHSANMLLEGSHNEYIRYCNEHGHNQVSKLTRLPKKDSDHRQQRQKVIIVLDYNIPEGAGLRL